MQLFEPPYINLIMVTNISSIIETNYKIHIYVFEDINLYSNWIEWYY